jgi:magnesium transporter
MKNKSEIKNGPNHSRAQANSTIEIFDYDSKKCIKKDIKSVKECLKFKNKKTITWISVIGNKDIETIAEFGKIFEIHPLIQEDIANTQRSKIEEFDNFIFLILKMIYTSESGIKNNFKSKRFEYSIEKKIITEQVSLVIGKNFVISFQEKPGDVFDGIRQKIFAKKSHIRTNGSDYLAYSLIDAIVDNYFTVLEEIGENIGVLEDEVVKNPNKKTLGKIHSLKRELIFLRKAVWPLREVINKLQKTESQIMTKKTEVYLRDLYDHTIQIIDTIESYRDMSSGMLDIYLSSINNRMNEVMKFLTIIATIFIPLTFITGIYGMNFKNMPELEIENAYFIVLMIMALVGIGMLYYFRKQKWV